MNQQQAFDKALNGVRAQGYRKSIHPTQKCAYRGLGGLKCGVGHLIEDDALAATLDTGLSTGDSTAVRAVFHCLPTEVQECGKDFLESLQSAHDGEPREDMTQGGFEDSMAAVADRYGLTYTAPVQA